MSKKELTLEALPEMKKNDYKKLFKKIMTWKKAKAVILLEDYKLDGKKTSLVIPFKKSAEMQKEFKKVRAEGKLHKPNKIAAALFSLNKDVDGSPLATITLKKGSISPQKVLEKIAPAFESIGVKLAVAGAGEEGNAAEASPTTSTTTSTAEQPAENVNIADALKNATTAVSDFKNGILPAYKDGELSEDAYQMAVQTETRLEAFVALFPTLSGAEQSKYEKLNAAAKQILPQLEKIMAALSGDDPQAALEMNYKQLKTAAKSIEKQTKKIKKTVLKNIKKGRATDRDLEVVDNCLQDIEDFEAAYEDSDERIKEKLAKHAERIQDKIKAQMQQLFNKVIEVAPMRQDNREENEAFKARMQEVKEQLRTIQKEIDEIELALAKEEQEPLPAGGEFLSFLSL